MYPSIESLQRITVCGKPLTLTKARDVRNAFRRCAGCYAGLLKAEEIIGFGLGVEHIRRGRNHRSPAIDYVNAGDTYATTLLLVNGRFRVGSWGDIVERGNYD